MDFFIYQTFLFNNLSLTMFIEAFSFVCYFFYVNDTSSKNTAENYENFMCYSNTIKKNFNCEIKICKDQFETLREKFLNNFTYEKYCEILEKSTIVDIIHTNCADSKYFKQNLKDFNNYFTNIENINYIVSLINGYKLNFSSICNLFSGSGRFIFNLYVNSNTNATLPTHFYLYDNDNKLNNTALIGLLFAQKNKLNFNLDNILINQTDLLFEDKVNETFNLVVGDLPIDVKNIIYANCNDKIKKLKIRGTKSEPLILQFATQILNKNGIGIIIVPNSLLFCDSQQHILTRKYLIENFLIKVIDIGNKKSILIFEKTKPSNIILSNKENSYNKVITIQDTISNGYSLYYNNYIKPDTYVNKTELTKITDIIHIYTNKEYQEINNKYSNINILYSYKFNKFDIGKINEIKTFDYVFVSTNPNEYLQDFINNYLYNFFTKNKEIITKGKMNQINIETIKNLNIKIPNITIQNKFICLLDNDNKILKLIELQIENLSDIKNNFIEKIINGKEKIELGKILNISHSSFSKNTIYINRNSNLAGTVNLTTTNKEETTNNYYINIVDNSFIFEYLYFILIYYEKELIKLANNNNTISLSRKNLENFSIPLLTNEEQKNLILKIKQINTSISNYENYKNINGNFHVIDLITL